MDIEKLIETLRQHGVSCVRAYGKYCSICDEAATALSTLQAENEKLRADVVRFNDMLASYQNVIVPELRVELEKVKRCIEIVENQRDQMKRERDAAIDCIYKIEDALDRGNDNDWAREHISEWESQKEG